MSLPQPSRGEIWFLNLDPTQGREQVGSRPALVISVDAFNWGLADLVVVLPVTSVAKGIPFSTCPYRHPKAACGSQASSSAKTSGPSPGPGYGNAGVPSGDRRWRPLKTGFGF